MTTMKTIELCVNFIQDPIEKPPIILAYEQRPSCKNRQEIIQKTKELSLRIPF